MRIFKGRAFQTEGSVSAKLEAELGVCIPGIPWRPLGLEQCEQGEKGRERKGKRDQRGQILQDSTDFDETVWLVPGGDEQKDMMQFTFSWTGSDRCGRPWNAS